MVKLDRFKVGDPGHADRMNLMVDAIEELQAENAKLRAALDEKANKPAQRTSKSSSK